MANITSSYKKWLLILACLATPALGQTPVASTCPPCDYADTLLKPCNSSLQINTWPATNVYQPTQQQAQCACNQNFYGEVTSCLVCQSSSSAHYSVKPLADYKLVCISFGQTTFPPVNIPSTTTSVTSASPTDTNSSSSDPTSTGSKHTGLGSGAIAGIIVSVLALIIAMSVAGYVYGKRKRDLERQKQDDELYKYQDTTRSSYMESPLPQYTGIQSSLPALPQLTNLRVMNPDNDDEEVNNSVAPVFHNNDKYDSPRTSSPGWRRGSFDDD